MFHGYYDFLLNDIKIKPKSNPEVLHHKSCPTCERKLVNLYYSAQSDKYVCKICLEKNNARFLKQTDRDREATFGG